MSRLCSRRTRNMCQEGMCRLPMFQRAMCQRVRGMELERRQGKEGKISCHHSTRRWYSFELVFCLSALCIVSPGPVLLVGVRLRV
jgi:hypothetical protein